MVDVRLLFLGYPDAYVSILGRRGGKRKKIDGG